MSINIKTPEEIEKMRVVGALAAKQRDQGLLHPGDPDYDRKISQMWGGPPIQWFDEAMHHRCDQRINP